MQADLLRSDLPQLHTLALTISHHNTDKPAPEGEFEGDCAANRDATMVTRCCRPYCAAPPQPSQSTQPSQPSQPEQVGLCAW